MIHTIITLGSIIFAILVFWMIVGIILQWYIQFYIKNRHEIWGEELIMAAAAGCTMVIALVVEKRIKKGEKR